MFIVFINWSCSSVCVARKFGNSTPLASSNFLVGSIVFFLLDSLQGENWVLKLSIMFWNFFLSEFRLFGILFF
jgi:hypothetical protein